MDITDDLNGKAMKFYHDNDRVMNHPTMKMTNTQNFTINLGCSRLSDVCSCVNILERENDEVNNAKN